MASPRTRQRSISAAFVIACTLPAILLAWRFASDELGANPIEEITHVTGEWGLRLLVLTLCVTPLRKLTGWSWLAPQRRSLGLFAFFYATLHFLTYAVLDLGLELGFVVEDVLERPYITIGFSAFLLLLPLALTSTKGQIKRLGRRWVTLHRLVYVAAALAVLHFFWLVKADVREPLVYAAIVAGLLGWRASQSRWLRSFRTQGVATG